MRRLRDLSVRIFGFNWYDKTLWKGLDLVITDWDNKATADMNDLESAFTVAVLCRVERDALVNMETALLAAEKILGPISAVSSGASADKTVFGPAWEDHWWLLGVDTNGAEFLAKRAARLQAAELDSLLGHFDALTVAYDAVAGQMLAAGALLLYFNGDEYYDLETLTAEFASGAVSDWLSAWRFLGQAFYGNDGAVGKLMLNYLLDRQPDFSGQTASANILFETILLFFVWRDYEYLFADIKAILFKKYLWAALAVGVPLEKLVKLDLAEEQFLDYYLSSCHNLTVSLAESTEQFIGTELDTTTVGGFIKSFLATAGASDSDGYEQASFVRAQIAENHWPVEWEGLLLRILYLFVHLRECDLIDYKGLLSEAGLVPRPFEWKQIIREDLTVEKLKIIKEYLITYNRPFTAKMEMIVEFMKVAYDSEPFLSRILALSELFDEVYGPQLSPLMFFSEEEGKWRLNNTLPPRPVTV